jgi:hypothetical protein
MSEVRGLFVHLSTNGPQARHVTLSVRDRASQQGFILSGLRRKSARALAAILLLISDDDGSDDVDTLLPAPATLTLTR